MENMCCLKTELKDGDIVEFGVAVFSCTDSAICAMVGPEAGKVYCWGGTEKEAGR
jgi:hypothetical protein